MTETLTPLSTNEQLLSPGIREDIPAIKFQNDVVALDTSHPMYEPYEIGLPSIHDNNEAVSVVGETTMRGHGKDYSIALVKLKGATGEEDYFAVGLNADASGKQIATPRNQWGRLHEALPLTLGRGAGSVSGQEIFGVSFDEGISRKHMSIQMKGSNIVIEDTSSNGSSYIGNKKQLENEMFVDQSFDYHSDHTMSAEDAARLRGHLRKDESMEIEMFAGRPTIGRDTFPIDGHVDIRSWVAGGEAIVVDSKKYPKEFNELRASLNSKLEKAAKVGLFQKKSDASSSEEKIIKAIYETVNEAMSYDMAFANAESEDVANGNNGHRKAALNNYLVAGKGVCRHMALAVSWLGGDAFERGVLNGRFTTEVNQSDTGRGAHEWSRYVDANSGEVYIIDVAQHFVGKLADTLDKKPSGREYWGYFRNKEERDAYRQVKLAGKLIKGADIIPNTLNNKIISSEDIPR